MTIDEFEIGEKYFYEGMMRFCVDKGTKSVTLTYDTANFEDTNDSEHWFVIGGIEFDYCHPTKIAASDQSGQVFLRWADMLEERLETALSQLVETQANVSIIRAKVAELKVHCRRSPSNKGASNEHEKTL